MNPTTFDSVARLFAARKLSRRAAFAGGAGLGAAALGAAALGAPAPAQAATPAATPTASGASATAKREFLFVQSFETGSLTPKAGTTDQYVLELKNGLGQTLFFSDRPERVVGAAPTETFLKNLGFSPSNPPNAALVADLGGEDQDVVVLELTNPQYDVETKSATYDVSILQDAERVNMTFTENPHQGPHPAETYGPSHLFIDDCPDSTNDGCYVSPPNSGAISWVADITSGNCWQTSPLGCNPCGSYSSLCNESFPDACQGNCVDEIELCSSPGCASGN